MRGFMRGLPWFPRGDLVLVCWQSLACFRRPPDIGMAQYSMARILSGHGVAQHGVVGEEEARGHGGGHHHAGLGGHGPAAVERRWRAG